MKQMFWFNKKQLPPNIETFPDDQQDVIYGNSDGSVMYPLELDPESELQYANALPVMREILRNWMLLDIKLAADNGQPLNSTLSYQIKSIDLKFLPTDTMHEALLRCMHDTPANYSGTRLQDAFVRIALAVPTPVLQVFTGRFLYGMLYSISNEINGIPVPTKPQWIALLAELPWVPYLVLIQDIFETDKVLSELFSKISEDYSNRNSNNNEA